MYCNLIYIDFFLIEDVVLNLWDFFWVVREIDFYMGFVF